MFVWKERLAKKVELTKAQALDASSSGSNRRATGLVPFPVSGSRRDVQEAGKVRYQQLLISIEGKQSTCCIKVVSPGRKSRAALLVFRGRALGCIYGRKNLPGQLFGLPAFKSFLDDLSDSDSIVDTYILPEELALAAGSLFHGEVFHQPVDLNASETFDYVYNNLASTQMPGCIVVKRMGVEEVVAFVYMFAGRVVGVFSFADGWLEGSKAAGRNLVDCKPGVLVSASKLLAANVQEVFDLSFSLNGIGCSSSFSSPRRSVTLS